MVAVADTMVEPSGMNEVSNRTSACASPLDVVPVHRFVLEPWLVLGVPSAIVVSAIVPETSRWMLPHVTVALTDWVPVRSVLLNLLAYTMWAIFGVGLGSLFRGQVAAVVTGMAIYFGGAAAVLIVFNLIHLAYHHTWVLAAPVVARHGILLAVENHKDYRSDELVALMRTLESPHVGVCVDTGNNLALLEEPLATVEALAPWAFSCHLKDMAVDEHPEGFLLSEVPLGEGFLDLARIASVLRRRRPAIRFSIEMITRDPLRIPCLTRGYWATLEDMPASRLAAMLALVRTHAARDDLPQVRDLSPARRIERSMDPGRATESARA